MDQALILFDSIISDGYSRIEGMVGSQDEHLFIDMKLKSRIAVLGSESTDRARFSKAISGFANAGGGVIIWGLDCRKDPSTNLDVVRETQPIPNLQRFINDLNQYLPQSVQPYVLGVENRPIMCPGESDTGFVITYVPESDLTPHRSLSDNLYYVRSGSNFVRVDHPMLADMFGRRQRPKLELVWKIDIVGSYGKNRHCKIEIGIRNIGRFVAVYPAIVIRPVSQAMGGEPAVISEEIWCIRQSGYSSPRILGRNQLDNSFMWSGGLNDVIHPKTTMTLTSIDRMINFNRNVLPTRDLHLMYELFAQGCQPVEDELLITVEDIAMALNIAWPPIELI